MAGGRQADREDHHKWAVRREVSHGPHWTMDIVCVWIAVLSVLGVASQQAGEWLLQITPRLDGGPVAALSNQYTKGHGPVEAEKLPT